MDEDVSFELWIGLICLAIGFLFGGSVAFNMGKPDLKACAREHNVYECQLIATPVSMPEELAKETK